MAAPTVQSEDFTIKAAFSGYYAVPDYQRDYVWEIEQVEQLLTDILNELGDRRTEDAAEYFIGSIVTCPRDDGTFELIDGQQRMTTIFLILCAIRDRIVELGQSPSAAHQALIAAADTDMSGNEVHRFRLVLQYPDSGDVLEAIAKNEAVTLPSKGATRSMTNIRNAYVTALRFLQQAFQDDLSKLRGFLGYVTHKVKIVRIQTENVAKALKVFETINDRGKGLDAMDLLKNLLFMKASANTFDKLGATWKQLQDKLYKANEKPLRFLRYYIVSTYDVDELREDEIYGWLSKNDGLVGYSKNPHGFAKQLLDAATAYAYFLEGKDARGIPNRYLKNITLLGGKSAKQHLILLLAGRSHESTMFNRLCSEVECLFFTYIITREATRDFERNFSRWANEIRKAQDEEELEAVINARFATAKQELSVRFDLALQTLTDEKLQGYRVMYVLAKLTQYVELEAYGENEKTLNLSNLTNGGYEIEHVLAQKADDEALAEFGGGDVKVLIHQLGNLALLEKSANGSIGNGPYSKKRVEYAKSTLLLTKLLDHKPSVGTATKINKAVADLVAYNKWDEGTIWNRQMELARLARIVWRIGAAHPARPES